MNYFIIVLILVTAYILVKNNNAYVNQNIIAEAIFHHNVEHIRDYDENGYLLVISYDCIEPYWKTFIRFWDWGYKNIVDKETFEKIQPYIKGE